MVDLTIIIPCYNEEGNISECIERIPPADYETEIIVVDDGSKDKTAEIAKKAKNNNIQRIKVISYKKNKGKGYAFRKGLIASKGEVVIILDADMSCLPEEIPKVVKPIFIGNADFINGTRLIYQMAPGAMNWLHALGNKIFAFILSLITGTHLTDALCGFKAFKKNNIPLNELKEDSWMDFELLIKASRNKMRIKEIPIHYKARKAGISKMKTFKDGFKLAILLAKSLKN